MTETSNHNIAALFDFDGVVVDTETQYSNFWKKQGELYHPDMPDFATRIKGSTLMQIFDNYFKDMNRIQQQIREELTEFEQQMSFPYIPGVVDFLKELRSYKVHLAVVTSSDRVKMERAFKALPELNQLFDRILMAEDFTRSKPFPDCYLLGSEVFQTPPSHCFVFEDSFNGLKSGKDAGMTVIGLSTTNTKEAIADMASIVIPDFKEFTYQKMIMLLNDGMSERSA